MFQTLLVPILAVLLALSASAGESIPAYRRERRLLPIDKAGPFFGVTSRTMRSYAAKKFFPLYRMSGVRGVLVDLDEVTAAMRKVPARRAKAGLGSYGGATIIDLSESQVEVVE